jgi:hypothetical protein
VSACEPRGSDPDGTKPVHCTVVVDGPKRFAETDVITARVRYRCGSPGAQPLTLKLRLERETGEDKWGNSLWGAVSTKTFTLRGKDSVAPELKYNEKAITISCREGVFRTVVDWSRTSRGDKEGDNLISGSVRDPCKKLLDE